MLLPGHNPDTIDAADHRATGYACGGRPDSGASPGLKALAQLMQRTTRKRALVTIDDATLALARDMGAEMTVNAAAGDPIREMQRQIGGVRPEPLLSPEHLRPEGWRCL
jgi:hypothetical protein